MKAHQKIISQFTKGQKLAYEGNVIEITEKGTHKGVGFIKGSTVVGGEQMMFYCEFTGDCNPLFEEVITTN